MRMMVFKQILFGFILMSISLGTLVVSQMVRDEFIQKGAYLVCGTSMVTAISFTMLAIVRLGTEAGKNQNK
jgi:hypothetical protein